jgi:hypothetical protein
VTGHQECFLSFVVGYGLNSGRLMQGFVFELRIVRCFGKFVRGREKGAKIRGSTDEAGGWL